MTETSHPHRLFHLVPDGSWSTPSSYEPASLATDGFVHCSFADQLVDSANRHYPDADELIAVEIDATALDVPLEIEDTMGHGEPFPHIYGAVPAAAITTTHDLERSAIEPHEWTWPRRRGGSTR